MKKPLNTKTQGTRRTYIVHFSPVEKEKLRKAAIIDNKDLGEFVRSAGLRVAHRRASQPSQNGLGWSPCPRAKIPQNSC